MSEQLSPELTPYQRIGGEIPLRKLVKRFYELMDELPEAYETRKLHPADLQESEDKLVKFLSGWLGGPSLYIQEFGHPRLRARHLPFAISRRERDQWLLCMYQAMDEMQFESDVDQHIRQALFKTADHMRNQAE